MRDYVFIALIFISTALLIGIRYIFVRYVLNIKPKHKNSASLSQPAPLWVDISIIFLIIVIAASLILSLGRSPLCVCGTIRVWAGDIWSVENSQQISDPYTFTHLTHGFLFYGLFWLIGRKLPLGLRAVLAIMLEAGWEVLENTNMVVDRYRTVTLATTYYGDSVINSVFDMLAMLLGFVIASKIPTRVSIAGIIILEIILALLIKDSLLLSTLMLLYPIEFIKIWQMSK